MALRKKANKSKGSKDLLGIMIIVVVVIVTVGILFSVMKYQKNEMVYNQQTLCPEDQKNIRSHIAILVDSSEPYNKVQLAYLDKYISNFINQNIAKHDKVSIYTIDDKSYKKLIPTIEICNPGVGDDINPLIGNPEMAKRKWSESFNKPLTNSIKDLFDIGQSDISPIMEMIQAVAIKSFSHDAGNKKLIIISDLIQNTSDYSHYKTPPNFKIFVKTAYYKHVKTDLNNVEVTVLYLLRKGIESMQNRKHIMFWEEYINSLGGQIVKVENVEG